MKQYLYIVKLISLNEFIGLGALPVKDIKQIIASAECASEETIGVFMVHNLAYRSKSSIALNKWVNGGLLCSSLTKEVSGWGWSYKFEFITHTGFSKRIYNCFEFITQSIFSEYKF